MKNLSSACINVLRAEWYMQDEILKVAAEAAIQRREAAEANATPDVRIAIQHAKAAKAKELRKKEVC